MTASPKGWVAGGFAIGITVGLCLDSAGIDFKAELSAGDLLEAVTSIVLATVLWRAAGQLSDRHKFLVEHVMVEVNELSDVLRRIDRFFDDALEQPRTLEECRNVVTDFRRAVNQASDIDKRLVIVGLHARCSDSLRKVREALGSFKQTATAVGIPVDNYRLSQKDRNKFAACSTCVQEAVTALVRDLVS